ncbi:hypothetical protein DM02DRAFT_113164 [Periconia macrospinosa]|uniref:Uncharacterized protein n=1 Tax=Periconia macrospinosa TaxID=97972 RepID=A0A2V1E7J7_9PLEO|nr:hypothetical protein DM02DRAFT_113164 [Periconia macrospinosa]
MHVVDGRWTMIILHRGGSKPAGDFSHILSHTDDDGVLFFTSEAGVSAKCFSRSLSPLFSSLCYPCHLDSYIPSLFPTLLQVQSKARQTDRQTDRQTNTQTPPPTRKLAFLDMHICVTCNLFYATFLPIYYPYLPTYLSI